MVAIDRDDRCIELELRETPREQRARRRRMGATGEVVKLDSHLGTFQGRAKLERRAFHIGTLRRLSVSGGVESSPVTRW